MKPKTIIPMLVIFLLITSAFSPKQAFASNSSIYFEQHVISNYIPDGIALFAGDMDGDGDIDILSSERSNFKFYLYLNDGYQNFTVSLIDNIDVSYTVAADLDQDGDMDIAVGTTQILGANAFWYENQGDMTFVRHPLAQYGNAESSFMDIIDLDHDGDPDLISNANGWYVGHVDWLENDGNGNFTQHEILNFPSPENWGCVSSIPVDMDKDGDYDLVQACDTQGNPSIFWLENDGSQNFTTQHSISRPWVECDPVQAVDMDNDGDIDVVGADWNDGTFWWENDGSQNFTEHRISSNRWVVLYLTTMDVDQDGDMDVVEPVLGSHQVSLWLNDGNMNFSEQIVANVTGVPIKPFIVDLDKDGDEDILVLDKGDPGSLSWYEQKQSNQPPTVEAGGPYQVDEGSSVVLTATGNDPEGASLVFDWDLDNDGVFETAGQSVSFSAAGLDGPGSSTVVARVTDVGGLSATSQATVIILNTGPTATISNDGPVNEGSPVTIHFSDPYDLSNADIVAGFHYAFDCDGNIQNNVTYTTSDADDNYTCVFDDDLNVHTVWARILDKDDGFADYYTTVEVQGVAPTAVFANTSGVIEEGESANLAFSEPYDPSQADTTAGFLFSYDCSNDDIFESFDTSETTYSCGYAENGIYAARGRIKDKDGAFTDFTANVLVTNVPPVVGQITAPLTPIQINNPINTYANFNDQGILDTHTATWEWDDGTTSSGVVSEANGSGSVSGAHSYILPGVYTIILSVTDDDGDSGESEFQYVVIYDPEGGFVTGGGWTYSQPGAYKANPALDGKINYGFNSKYKQGTSVPMGNLEFQLKAAELNFHSEAFQWMVVDQGSSSALFKGTGTINGDPAPVGNYHFMMWVTDRSPDTFQMKIWWVDANGIQQIIYDNGTPQPTGGGNIKIH